MGATPAAIQSESLWAAVKEAVRGSHRDFTQGNINRAIFLLSLPMVLEMVMESLFGIVDVYFVAHLGPDAVATVGLAESQLTIVMGVAMGLSMGTAAVVARRTGEKNPEGASTAAAQGLLLTLGTALILALTGLFLGPTLLQLMGASESVLSVGSLYSRLMLGSSGIILLLFVINAIFRGAGDAAVAMRVLWLANAINLVLDPCLIRGLGPFPELGVTGAAVATTTGRGIGVLYQLYLLFGRSGRIKLRWQDLRVDPVVIRTIGRLSLSGMGQYLIGMASWVGLIRIMSTFGSTALAGYTIAIRIVIFSILPSWGMSNAAATLVGQNLGAKQPDRAEKSAWAAAKWNAVFLFGVSVLFIFGAEFLLRIFTDEQPVIEVGTTILRVICSIYVPFAFGLVIVQAFNGAGDTRTPTLINLFAYWVVQLPLAYLLALTLGWGPFGVAVALAVADVCLAVAGIVVFRRGTWKQQQV